MTKASSRVCFDEFAFDPTTLELHRGNAVVHLQLQPSQVLDILLANAGRLVTRDELRERVWKDKVLEFDGGLNYTIRQIRLALGDSADRPIFVETVHGRGYRFIGKIALDAPAPVPTGMRFAKSRIFKIGAVAVVVTVALALWAWRVSRDSEAANANRVLVAVLPFTSLSDNDSLNLFARGLTEDLITTLASLSPQHLGVIASTSVHQLRDEQLDPADVRRLLGAEYTVRGTVRQSGAVRRITVTVEDTESASPILARGYDRHRGRDLIAQTEIAVDIAAALSVEVLNATPSDYEGLTPAIQDSLLATRWLLDRQTAPDAHRALDRLELTRVSRPNYAPAWAMTAQAFFQLGDFDRARDAAGRAIELAPRYPEGHFQLAQASTWGFQFDQALRSYRQTVDLAPGVARYHHAMANLLANLLQFDDALHHLELARVLDPLSAAIEFDIYHVYLSAGRYDDAITYCSKSLELIPETPWVHQCLFAAFYFKGDLAGAHRVATDIMRLTGATVDQTAEVVGRNPESGIRSFFVWNLNQLEAQRARGETVFDITMAEAYGQLRRRTETIGLLTTIADQRTLSAQWIAGDVWFRFLHGDPEFEQLIAEIGMTTPTPAR